MQNISFGSTFLNIQTNYDNEKVESAVNNCLYSIQSKTATDEVKEWLTFDEHSNLYRNFIVPDQFDNFVETYLLSQNIKFTKLTNDELFNETNIKKRLRVEPCFSEKYKLRELNTEKFDKIFKETSFQYLGEYPNMRAPERYDGVKEYIKTNNPIDAPIVFLQERNGALEVGFQDGTHRYAVMRDMGFKTIPFAINEESFELAKKYGLA